MYLVSKLLTHQVDYFRIKHLLFFPNVVTHYQHLSIFQKLRTFNKPLYSIGNKPRVNQDLRSEAKRCREQLDEAAKTPANPRLRSLLVDSIKRQHLGFDESRDNAAFEYDQQFLNTATKRPKISKVSFYLILKLQLLQQNGFQLIFFLRKQ